MCDPRVAHERWCSVRRELYATHPQSPVPAQERTGYSGPHVWPAAYGGGLFVPFADATSGRESYGAGRYVLDLSAGAAG